uniref:Uncharacterized protein n=1 Tax=Amphora coffeiformis TaxID=265554 RepID=A0A7S3LGC6_9STRA|mmetsp:Transcript_5621/g.11211  ORF Transcript_5621/g.11211 Transcript_5621/m.11211 type:complete len:137 (-) Transcript_5621:199-609(-)
MFAGYRDEVDGPTAADDGVFIPQKQLQTWWKTLQKKFPGIYPPNEPCPDQYPAGTRLMCYENDDPSKPVRIQIVGSRWRKDQLMGKQAIYVIQHCNDIGTDVYDATEFTTAHEEDPEIGWTLGWDNPPPTAEPEQG